jgi:hypothetical protein
VLRLILIGLVAGLFSALFGVGGGIVVVPLLILVAHFDERPAMATSLGAIGLIAFVGAATYALHGELKVGAAAVVGLPATVGALGGTWLQQRLATRTLTLAFAALLAAIAVWLLVRCGRSWQRAGSGSPPACSRGCSASAAGSCSSRR